MAFNYFIKALPNTILFFFQDNDNENNAVDFHYEDKHISEKLINPNQSIDLPIMIENVNSLQHTKQPFENDTMFTVKRAGNDIAEKDQTRNNEEKTVFGCGVSVIGYTKFDKHIKRHGLKKNHISKTATLNSVKPGNISQIPNFRTKNIVNFRDKNILKSANTNVLKKNTFHKSKNDLIIAPTNTLNSENDLIFCELCGIPVLKTDHEVHVRAHDISKYTCWSCDECFYDNISWGNHQEICKNLVSSHESIKHTAILNLNCDIKNNCTDNNTLQNDITLQTEDTVMESSMAIITEDGVVENSLTIKTEDNLAENNIVVTSSSVKSVNEPTNYLDNNTCFDSNSDTEANCISSLEPSMKREKNEINETSKKSEQVIHTEKPIPSQIYKCGICGFKDESMVVVRNHVDNHNQIQRCFKCDYCNLAFSKKTVLSLHILRRHKNINSGHCLFCKKMFLDKTHLNVHIEKDHSDVKTSPFCAYCGKMHTTEADLKTHILRHHFNDYNAQFSEEISLKDNLLSNDTLNHVNSQTVVNLSNTSNAFDKVFSKNLESNHQEVIDKNESCTSSFYVKPKQEVNEQQEVPNVCCAMCDFKSKEDSEMTEHIICHQTAENNFCKICCQFFCSKDFNKHLNHGPEFQGLQCKYCSDLTHDAVHLKCHTKKMHHEIDLHNCKYCSKVYTEKSALLKHIKIKHTPDKEDKSCKFCKTSFKNDRHYSNHIEYAHRTTLDCKICGKELQNWKKLQYHEKAHLKFKKTSYNCDICSKVLKTKTGLRFHKIRHTGNFPFFCEFCGQGFVSTHSLTEHIGHHTKETRYTCDVCGKGFYYYDTMYRHRILHDNPYPKTCDICNKNFRNSSRVAIHKRREHTGERPYKCTYCPQTFFTSNGYKHHLCLHTKIFPYNCKACNKGFTTRHKYAIHLSRKHSDHTLLINRAPNNKEWNEQWLK